MFSRQSLISAMGLAFANAQTLTATFTGCAPTYPTCPTDYVQSSGCDCCPVAGSECDAKYLGQFCIGTQLNPNTLPLSCPQRQAIQTTCTNTCLSLEVRQDDCTCCPKEGKECATTPDLATKYCTSSALDFTKIPATCPQKKVVPQICTNTCTTAPDTEKSTFCDCCPPVANKCDTSTDATFKAKYCNADKTFNFTNLAPSCPQNFDSTLKPTCKTACVENTWRPESLNSCSCCPIQGKECSSLYPAEKYCTNGKIDASKIPPQCPNKASPCNTFCGNDFVVGLNCSCCPIPGKECDSMYGGLYNCNGNVPDMKKIPDGCPTKEAFLKATTCPSYEFHTPAGQCCPAVGKECDVNYYPVSATNNEPKYCTIATGSSVPTLDLTKFSSTQNTCPQKQSTCFNTCPTGYNRSTSCDCCPELYNECDTKYNNQFCSAEGVLLLQNVPPSCPQHNNSKQACTYEVYDHLEKFIKDSGFTNLFVSMDCEVCPKKGEECATGNDKFQEYCLKQGTYSTIFLANIPKSCPSALKTCDQTIYTTTNDGECCPKKGEECSSAYGGKYCTKAGEVLLMNIPSGCPQWESSTGCNECPEFMLPVGTATSFNCNCCPVKGQECNPVYNNKFCDFNGNIIWKNIADNCPSKVDPPACDARWFWTAKDGSCCPFKGKECDAVYNGKYCPVDLSTTNSKLGAFDKNTLPLSCQDAYAVNKCASVPDHNVLYTLNNCVACPIVGVECTGLYTANKYCTNGVIDPLKIPNGCPQKMAYCVAPLYRPVISGDWNNLCCPTGDQAKDACETKYGKEFCDVNKSNAVLADFARVPTECTLYNKPITACSEAAGNTELLYKTGTVPACATTCAKTGLHCVGSNSTGSTYCAADQQPTDITGCDNVKATIDGASACKAAPAAGYFWATNTDPCVKCPLMGQECVKDDGTTSFTPYPSHEFCTRTGTANTDYTYKLHLMNIPKECPQRRRGYNLFAATFYKEKKAQVWCIDQTLALTFGTTYGDWNSGTSKLAVQATGSQTKQFTPCKVLSAANPCTGTTPAGMTKLDNNDGTACIFCPDLNNLCDPVYNNAYCSKAGVIDKSTINKQCLPESKANATLTPPVPAKACPAAIDCGDATMWEISDECDCCPLESYFTSNANYCTTTANAGKELAILGCSATPAAGVTHVWQFAKIPASCTNIHTASAPPKTITVNAQEQVSKTGVTCPALNNECAAQASSASKYCETTGLLKTSIDASCPTNAFTWKTVCKPDWCPANTNIVLPTGATTFDKCVCCPPVGKECDDAFNGKYCSQNGKINLGAIDLSCPQHKNPSLICNPDWLDAYSYGRCCPREGLDCYKPLEGLFCNFDGSFKKNIYNDIKCPVPVCNKSCPDLFLNNGCACCPVPGFEKDAFYNGQFTDTYGEPIVSDACKTLKLFPIQPVTTFKNLNWVTILNTSTVDIKPFLITGLPPTGTFMLGNYMFGEGWESKNAEPADTLPNIVAKGVQPNVNEATSGAVYSMFTFNNLYRYLNDSAIQTSLAGWITAFSTPTNAETQTWLNKHALGNTEQQTAFNAMSDINKRYKLITSYMNEPRSDKSRFCHQDCFDFGLGTNCPKDTDDTKFQENEFKLIEALKYTGTIVENKDIATRFKDVLADSKASTMTLGAFVALSAPYQAWKHITNANASTTFNAAYFTTGVPLDTKNSNTAFTVAEQLRFSQLWYDYKYPGLQHVAATVDSGTVHPQVAANRNGVYSEFKVNCNAHTMFTSGGTAVKAGLAGLNDDRQGFYGYYLDKLMEQTINTWRAANPQWNPSCKPIQFSANEISKYLEQAEVNQSDNCIINAAITEARYITNWSTYYTVPANWALNSNTNGLFQENILGAVAKDAGIADLSKVVLDTATPATGEIKLSQAIGKIALHLARSNLKVTDVYVPKFVESDYTTLGLKWEEKAKYQLTDKEFMVLKTMTGYADTDLKLANNPRTAELTAAFGNNADAVTNATAQQKAAYFALHFFLANRKIEVKQFVKKPAIWVDFSYDASAAASIPAVADVFNGKVSPQVATYMWAKQYKYNVASGQEATLVTGSAPAWGNTADETYKATDWKTANTGRCPAAGAENTQSELQACYASIYTTLMFGIKGRTNAEMQAYFKDWPMWEGKTNLFQEARLDEHDFAAIDAAFTAKATAGFYPTVALGTLYGIDITVAGNVDKLLKRVVANDYAVEKIAKINKLITDNNLIAYLQSYGVTEQLLTDALGINSFETLVTNGIDSETVETALFVKRYGAICERFDTACTTGFNSNKAIAELSVLGLNRKIIEQKGLPLIDVLMRVYNYEKFTTAKARTENFNWILAYGAQAPYSVVTKEYTTKFLGFDTAVKQCAAGLLLAANSSSACTAADPVVTGTEKVHDYFTNTAYGHYVAVAIDSTLIAPKTNVDWFIAAGFTKTIYTRKLQNIANAKEGNEASDNCGGTCTNAVHADYGYYNFVKAMAKYPEFCKPQDWLTKDFSECKKQFGGLFTILAAESHGGSAGYPFKNSMTPAACTPTAASDNSCANIPDVETVQYHWLSRLISKDLTKSVFKPFGADIKGADAWYESFGVTSKFVNSDLSSATAIEMFEAVFDMWFRPNKINVIRSVSEASWNNESERETTHTYQFEDSYLTPSYNDWMTGKVSDGTIQVDTTVYDSQVSTPTTVANGAFQFIIRSRYGVNCQASAAPTAGSAAALIEPLWAKFKTALSGTNLAGVLNSATPTAPFDTLTGACTNFVAVTGGYAIKEDVKYNKKNYYSPAVFTVDPASRMPKIFFGDKGQCFNVHIETPWSIYHQDGYADCVAHKNIVLSGSNVADNIDFMAQTGFKYDL